MKPGLGWILIVAALIVAIFALGSWKAQRASNQPNEGGAAPPGKSSREAAKPAPQNPTVEKSPRERPERDRVDRP